ncbi:MAG: sodium:solute symporter [Cytophagaceae bacterium]|nr:sodium:solute symporter [Cytophagaceae bacterium]
MASSSQVIGAAILFFLYGIVIIYFVIKGSRKTKSISDYAVGSMAFSPVFVGLSLAAAMTSAATFVINPGLVATYGFSGYLSFGVFFPLASLVSLVVLSKSFRKFGQSVQAVSLASWIGNRYNSKAYSLFVAFLSLLLITFIILILVALTKVISQALNADQVWVLGILTAFVFGYMMFGGANSMVYTNTIQAIIMIAVAVILIGSGYRFFQNGITGIFDGLRNIDVNLVKNTNTQSPLFRDFFEIIFAQMVVGAAVVCQPHIITKSLLLKEETDVNKYLTTAVIVQFLFFSVVIAGLFARLEFPDMQYSGKPLNIDSIISAYVIQVFSGGTAALLVGLLVILGLISAGFSTIEGLIQSLSTTITTDIIKPLSGNKIEEKQITINRVVIVILGIVSFVFARQQLLHPNLSVAIFAQNGVYAYFSILFVPIVYGIFLKNIKISVPLSGSITAFLVYYFIYYLLPGLIQSGSLDLGYSNIYFSGKTQNPAIAAALAIVISLVVSFSLFLFTKKSKVENSK